MNEIVLSEQESEWAASLSEIDFDLDFDLEGWRAKSKIMKKLSVSLFKRRAIPEHRLAYFSEPKYNFGNPKRSHLDIFEENGTFGDDIYLHPHFLEYLRYFIYGAALPVPLKRELSEVRSRSRSGFDFVSIAFPILKRNYSLLGLSKDSLSEEAFKLCHDFGLDFYSSKALRDKLKKWKPKG